MRPNRRRAGILLHPTSLPGPHGIGALGDAAYRFLDWLTEAKMSCWQILPLVPPGAGDSPYSSASAFAISPWLLDLEHLRRDGLLDDSGDPFGPSNRVDFAAMRAFKSPKLQAAAARLLDGHALRGELEAFRDNHPWLADFALFEAIRVQQDQAPWWDWPTPLRDRDAKALAEARAELSTAIAQIEALQFLVDRQWRALKAACNSRGVLLIGDLPIYVDGNSADVWSNRDLFALDANGRSTQVAGVPPDAFSQTGQLWGNPLYRWDRLAQTGYAWWIERIRRAISLTDRVRIDHFRAFSAYWSVPADAEDARGGHWVEGPKMAFFNAVRDALGDLPILAEDLGVVDDGVIDLLEATKLPGMKVLQFAFGGKADNFYLPHNHTVTSVVYTGTHDNDTTLGWWLKAPEHEQDHVRRYFSVNGHDVVWDLIRAAIGSVAETAIVPMQDTLALGTEARMNTPSVGSGNWGWRLLDDQLRHDVADRLRGLVELYHR